jgi:hypothetical protein
MERIRPRSFIHSENKLSIIIIIIIIIIILEPSYLSNGLQTARPEFDSQQRQGIFLYSTASRRGLGSIQPPVRWVPGVHSLG